ARELHHDPDLAAKMNVLADVPRSGIAHEPRHRHVLSELADLRGDQLRDLTVGVVEPRVARGIARFLDGGQHLVDQLPEVVGARDEVRLAVPLDEAARRSIRREPVADEALFGRAAGLLARAREPALAQDRRRLLEVAARLGQGVLALHHPRAGLLAELLHHVCRDRDRCHRHYSSDPRGSLYTSRGPSGPRPSRYEKKAPASKEPALLSALSSQPQALIMRTSRPLRGRGAAVARRGADRCPHWPRLLPPPGARFRRRSTASCRDRTSRLPRCATQ